MRRRGCLLPRGFDPSSLSLTGWYRTNYGGADWTGTASAGSSGTRTLTTGTAPSNATTLNGMNVAAFDGSNDVLIQGTGTLDDYINAAAYSVVMLVRPKSAASAAGNIYDNDQIVSDSGGNFGVAWSSSGVAAWHYDGDWTATGWTALTGNTWAMVSSVYNGTDMSCRVNNGTAATQAQGNVSGLGVTLRLGQNFGSVFTEMDVAELMISDTELTTQLADVKSYFNTRYGLAL